MKTLSIQLARGLLAASVVLVSTQLQAADHAKAPARAADKAQAQQTHRSTSSTHLQNSAKATADQSESTDHTSASDAPQDAQQTQSNKPCHWWQFRRCDDNDVTIDGLPPEAPRSGTVITVDVSQNRVYLYQDAKLVDVSLAATGTGRTLKSGHTVWAFHTPRGHLKVLRKIEDPVWHKPDWAFVEAGEPVPPPDSPKRLVKNHLGKYALDLGDGIMIHGTDDPESIGHKASHGCIRLPDDMLEEVYKSAKVGTDVFIFESRPPQQATAKPGQPEHHSDLDE